MDCVPPTVCSTRTSVKLLRHTTQSVPCTLVYYNWVNSAQKHICFGANSRSSLHTVVFYKTPMYCTLPFVDVDLDMWRSLLSMETPYESARDLCGDAVDDGPVEFLVYFCLQLRIDLKTRRQNSLNRPTSGRIGRTEGGSNDC